MRFQSLDGWRGIAALFVSLYHLEFFNHLYDWDFLRNSYLFVDFFFVLSGFVITHAYQNRLNTSADSLTFIYRRIARLLPLHLFVLLLFIAFELLKMRLVSAGNWDNSVMPFTQEYSLPSLLSNIFLLQSMGLHDKLTWNYPSWSISVEFYTYIIFAIAMGISHKLKGKFKHSWNILAISLIALSLTILYVNTKNLSYATYDFGIFRCVAGFFLGSICYPIFIKHKDKIIPQATLVEIGLIAGIYFFVVYSGNNKLSVIAPIIFTFTVFIFSFEQGAISRLLKANVFQSLGKWSYSIYMLHALLLLAIGRLFNVIESLTDHKLTIEHLTPINTLQELIFFNNTYLMDLLTVIYLVVLVYIASLTYKHIELKGNQWFKWKPIKSQRSALYPNNIAS